MPRTFFLALILLTTTVTTRAQWQIHDAHTTADLRGIDNVGGGVAWASGTDGTILRTEDAGFVWQLCAKPPGGEHLDFRGVQGIDNNTAIIMSAGKGDLSRLYKTTDGCQTWHLLFTNPDKDGFWDALQFAPATNPGAPPSTRSGRVAVSRVKTRENDSEAGRVGYIAGDPVHGLFAEFITYDYGQTWSPVDPGVGSVGPAKTGEAMFAASNSTLQLIRNTPVIVTGGTTSRLREVALHVKHDPRISYEFVGGVIPFPHAESAGAFSFAAHLGPDSVAHSDRAKFVEKPTHDGDMLVAVGGDYLKPNDSTGTAAYATDGGQHWTAATTPPHGFRSAVAYDPTTKTWITVGPNGTDISTDDGRNWHALKPDPAFNDTPDADQHWNALSLPYAVGPHGRIGTLRPSALQPPK